MEYIENVKNFIMLEFTNICLVIATIVLVANTIQMSQDPRSKQTVDQKVYNYYVSNIVSLVFLSIFIFNFVLNNTNLRR